MDLIDTSLMVLGVCLYLVQNPLGVNTTKVDLFWICGSGVMSYTCSLSRYCLAFMYVASWRMLG